MSQSLGSIADEDIDVSVWLFLIQIVDGLRVEIVVNEGRGLQALGLVRDHTSAGRMDVNRARLRWQSCRQPSNDSCGGYQVIC